MTLCNDFHRTAVTLHLGEGSAVPADVVRHVRQCLCGVDSCVCGDELGLTGPQERSVTVTGYDHRGRITVFVE